MITQEQEIECHNRKILLTSMSQEIAISVCPGCGKYLVRKGPFLVCSDMEKCVGVQAKRIDKWISKREIMYLGDTALAKLIDDGVVKCIPDLYALTPEKMTKAGIGSGMTAKILEQIDKSRTVTLPNMIGSLSIDLLGRSEAENIYDFGIDTLEKWKKLTPEKLKEFEGFKDTKAERICDGLKQNWALIEEMAGLLVMAKKVETVKGGKFDSKSFCFTGALSETRDVFEKVVEKNGGTVAGVSKNLSYLVTKDPNSGSAKSVKAKALGVPVIDEAQFRSMAGMSPMAT